MPCRLFETALGVRPLNYQTTIPAELLSLVSRQHVTYFEALSKLVVHSTFSEVGEIPHAMQSTLLPKERCIESSSGLRMTLTRHAQSFPAWLSSLLWNGLAGTKSAVTRKLGLFIFFGLFLELANLVLIAVGYRKEEGRKRMLPSEASSHTLAAEIGL